MDIDRWDLSGDCTGKEGYCEERISCQHKGDYVRYDEHIETLQAKDAEIAWLKRRIDQLESREIDVVVLQGDITDLTHANARLREALQAAKYELAALFPIPSAPTVHAALEVCGNNNEADARCVYLAYEAICAALTATSQPGGTHEL